MGKWKVMRTHRVSNSGHVLLARTCPVAPLPFQSLAVFRLGSRMSWRRRVRPSADAAAAASSAGQASQSGQPGGGAPTTPGSLVGRSWSSTGASPASAFEVSPVPGEKTLALLRPRNVSLALQALATTGNERSQWISDDEEGDSSDEQPAPAAAPNRMGQVTLTILTCRLCSRKSNLVNTAAIMQFLSIYRTRIRECMSDRWGRQHARSSISRTLLSIRCIRCW